MEPVTDRCIRCREKKLLVGSDDYGRDLTGVQNLRKKHKRIEAEISSHEPTIEVSGILELYKTLVGDHVAYSGGCGL